MPRSLTIRANSREVHGRSNPAAPRRVIPETFVQLLYEYLHERGIAPETLLGQPWPAPAHPDAGGVPIEVWAQLLERAATHLADPCLGLHLGATITPRHLGVLGYVLTACENLGAALLKMDRYQRLIFDVTPMTVRGGKGYVDLVWGVDDGRYGPLVDETGIAVLVQFCRSLVRTPEPLLAVNFVNRRPADPQPYLEFFGCPVSFGQSETVVRVSVATLALPLKTADPSLIAIMERQADRLLDRLPREEPAVELVRRTIARQLHESEPDIDSVAAASGFASRTLQRRLRAAGSSFRQELARVRRQMAETYLRDPRLSIADVALLLGYSEHSAFSRSFKEWTGVAAQRWRDNHAREVVEHP